MPRTEIIAAVICASASAAGAAFIEIDSPIVLQSDAVVSVELVGAWAGAAGDIYFLGAKRPGEALTASADTGEPGLGQRLFYSKAEPGERIDLGEFDAGSELHFAYHITKGSGDLVAQGDVFRSDRDTDQIQFGYDPEASTAAYYRLGMEDIRDPKRSDWDYQDVVFDVTMTSPRGVPVPAPGATLLLALSSGAAAARRRR